MATIKNACLGLIKSEFQQIYGTHMSKRAMADDHVMLTSFEKSPLTKEEMCQIDNMWNRIIPKPSIGYDYFAIYKNVEYFDPRFVAGSYYYPWIIRALNPKEFYHTLIHKSMFRHILSDLPQPITLLSDINGNKLSVDKKSINTESAIDFLFGIKRKLIIKGSVSAAGGKTVKFINADASKSEIRNILNEYKDNYVVQELVHGHSEMTAFNPTSLNTLRITTLLINNQISLCPSVFRVGAPGQALDNLQQGGLMIGINSQSGRLSSYGYSMQGEKVYERNNKKFEDFVVPNFHKAVDLAFEGHRRIAVCGFAAWDFAINEHGNPIFIEVNLYWPGIRVHQMAAGPILGDRTQEVIDYVHNLGKRNWMYIFERR